MKELTHRQGVVLAFIKTYINQHNYPPTIREIADEFNISVKGAHDHVSALKKKNAITSDKRSRTIGLTKNEEPEISIIVEVPILGSVAAGNHPMVDENCEGKILIPQAWFNKEKQYFALTVQGDSMTKAGILNGDYVLVEQGETAESGEIVVVMMNDTMTLKRYFREQTRIRLQSESDKYQPIFVQEIRLLGRVTQVIRYY